jgi:membrane-associated phospholipid phosphatase
MPGLESVVSRAEPITVARRIGNRVLLGGAAAVLLAVPFTLLTVLVLAKSPGLARLDLHTANRLHNLLIGHPSLSSALVRVGQLTEPWVLRGLALVAGVLLWRRGARRSAGWVVGTMAVAGLLSALLKVLVSRTRPSFTDPVTVAGGYSFPSGHALNSMTFAACAVILLHAVLGRRGRLLLWTGSAALVLVVGFDRISLGVHYVSDVLAGWTVGLATALATAAVFDRGTLRRLTVDPAKDPDRPYPTGTDPTGTDPTGSSPR